MRKRIVKAVLFWYRNADKGGNRNWIKPVYRSEDVRRKRKHVIDAFEKLHDK